MCTSFTYRGNDNIIAMNYDNHGMNLELAPYDNKHFIVTINSFGQKNALFGVNSKGVFANQQIVDECDGGKFRMGHGVTHTSEFIGKVLLGEIPMDEMDEYLDNNEIVNPPEISLHTMIANVHGNSYIIEPGRGNIKYGLSKEFFVMSNCSLFEAKQTGEYNGFGVDRQLKAEQMLKESDKNFNVKDAFEVLKAVHQTDEIWNTEFSLVYSGNENVVYYCYNHDFDNIQKYEMM